MKTRILASAVVALFMACSQAQAAFHLWQIRELYTNLNGSVQYIELFTASNNQQVVNGQSITITQQGTGVVHTFTIPSALPSSSTGGKAFLIGTSNLSLLGGPVPDFVIPAAFSPDNSPFLFPGGGTISFFGQGGGAYSALPTNGTLSYNYPAGTTAVNSPTNFSGSTGSVPEPTTCGLIALGGLAVTFFVRRRAA